MKVRRRVDRNGHPGARLFFATDIHGSEDCFRKFLNAPSVYRVSHLVLGGDILGKTLVPIARTGEGRYDCNYGEHTYSGLSTGELSEVKRRIRRGGDYTVLVSRDELLALSDEAERDRVFREVAYRSVADWVTLADERLRGTGVRCFVAPGNDDYLEIDSALRGSEVFEFAEGECLQLDEAHDIITTGYSNRTPWHTERELDEPDLAAKLAHMAARARSAENLVAVIHPPPYDSGLDSAPLLTEELAVQRGGSGIAMAPVGSTAVREFVEEQQPLVSLHGHVHEGGGAMHIGRTLCINPGSAYMQGTLRGAIIELADGAIRTHQFVTG
jgi:Icc-related predicted phosphoesterase